MEHQRQLLEGQASSDIKVRARESDGESIGQDAEQLSGGRCNPYAAVSDLVNELNQALTKQNNTHKLL